MKQLFLLLNIACFILSGMAQNVGIGTTATPKLGKLEVKGSAGAVSAIFYDQTTGIAIENSYPGIGFNSYYNSGRKAIATGFGALLSQNPATGNFSVYTSPSSVTGAGTVIPLTERLVILPNGNVGIGIPSPAAMLSIAKSSGIGGTLQINGTTNASHFNINATEDTYIRGGLSNSKVIIGDNATSNVTVNGIATGSKLSVYQAGEGIGISIDKKGNNWALFAQSNGTAPTIFANSTGTGPAIYTQGRVGVNNIDPAADLSLDVAGRMRLRGYDANSTAGLYFDGVTSERRSFIGTYTQNQMGVYGAASGWSFLMDVNDGSVSLGTTKKAVGYRLNVAGKIIAEEIRVQLISAWPDYVFAKNYPLKPLAEVENFIAANQHLPNVPAAAELEKSGIALGEMQSKMMEKIEELTLYVIQLKKEIDLLKSK